MTDKEGVTNQAVAEGGSYELIQRRLSALGSDLNTQIKQLNDERIVTFGSTDMKVDARVRVRTEHNCVACRGGVWHEGEPHESLRRRG